MAARRQVLIQTSLSWRWKLAILIATGTAFVSIWDNGRRVHNLEQQVCTTVENSLANVRPGPNQLAIWRDNPDDAQRVLDNALVTKRLFNCPIEEDDD